MTPDAESGMKHEPTDRPTDRPAYRGPAGMPMFDRSTVAVGSRGGARIWVMREAFVPCF